MIKRIHLPWPLWACVVLLTACAAKDPIRDAENRIAAGYYEDGLNLIEEMSRSEGHSAMEARAALVRNRAQIASKIARDAHLALDSGRLDEAERLYVRLARISPDDEDVKSAPRRIQAIRRQNMRLIEAEDLLRKGQVSAAERILREILAEAPKHRRAQVLVEQIAERQHKTYPLATSLGPEFKKMVSLEFRDVALKSVFDAIWHASGVNFILDRDVRTDAKSSLFVRDVSVEEAIDALLMTQQLAKKVVNAKTLFIYPKTPQKIVEYQDVVVRNFFLAHADAKQIQTMLKTILKTKEVFVDEKRNLVVIRDSQEGVDMAEKLVQAHDQPEPEVMLALDVIEIKRSKLSEIGISFPTAIGVGVGNPITIQALRNLNSSGINIGFGGLSNTTTSTGPGIIGNIALQKTDGDTNMLANPRIRVRNREKAKIHIGDRLPVVTTTSSATSTFVGQTVNYLDVGLKLEVEPQVMLDDDVAIKLNLEVSSATQSKVNAGFYDVGTRNTATVLTIRDGETHILAGLIRDDELESANRLPGLGEIPLLGRLFSSERREQAKTEIILAITPRVIRNLARPSRDLLEYSIGTEMGQRAATGASPPLSIPAPSPHQAPGIATTMGIPSSALPQTAIATPAPPAPSPAPPLTPGNTAAPTSSPPATTAPSGVIPLADFEPPPGAGINRSAP